MIIKLQTFSVVTMLHLLNMDFVCLIDMFESCLLQNFSLWKVGIYLKRDLSNMCLNTFKFIIRDVKVLELRSAMLFAIYYLKKNLECIYMDKTKMVLVLLPLFSNINILYFWWHLIFSLDISIHFFNSSFVFLLCLYSFRPFSKITSLFNNSLSK